MANFKITTSVDHLQNGYSVYQIHDRMSSAVIFVGLEKLSSMGKFNDFFSNPLMQAYRNEPEREFFISAFVLQDKVEAMKKRSELIREAGHPEANKYASVSRQGIIVCNETGDEFHTMTEAANAMRLSQGNLSKHLRNMPGHRTIKGYTFSYKNVKK